MYLSATTELILDFKAPFKLSRGNNWVEICFKYCALILSRNTDNQSLAWKLWITKHTTENGNFIGSKTHKGGKGTGDFMGSVPIRTGAGWDHHQPYTASREPPLPHTSDFRPRIWALLPHSWSRMPPETPSTDPISLKVAEPSICSAFAIHILTSAVRLRKAQELRVLL